MNKKITFIILAVLIAACLASYGRILNNGFVDYDDEDYLTRNINVQSGLSPANIKWAFTAVVSANWHPLTLISHMLDWSLFGDYAGGHHLVSLLLHIGNVLLLFLILSKATGNFWPAAFAAALFALHPLRVESVAWAAERKDVLSMLFGLGSLYAYTFYADKRRPALYYASLVLFVLGLLSKPMLVTLPFVMLLIDYWPLNRMRRTVAAVDTVKNFLSGRKSKRDKNQAGKKNSFVSGKTQPVWRGLLLEKVPFFIFSVASSIVTLWAQQKGTALVSFEVISFPERFINAVNSYVLYLGKILLPVDLTVFYPYPHMIPFWQLLGALLVISLISTASIFYIKKLPFLFVGWFWYLGTLIPVIGLVQVGKQAMADRYTYMPGIGLIIMIVWIVAYLFPVRKIYRNILIAAACIVLVVLSYLTWRQCGYWKNSTEMYNHALRSTKDNDQAHFGLANVLKSEGNIEEALKHYREAVRINPEFPDCHNNIGTILAVNYNQPDDAISHFRKALQIDPYNFNSHLNLAITLANKGEITEAVRHFQTAVDLNPDDENARRALEYTLSLQREQGKKY